MTKFVMGAADTPTTQESSHVEITNEDNFISRVFIHLNSFKRPNNEQAYCLEILKRFPEAVHRKMPELWPYGWILHTDNAPAHKVLSVKQFLVQSFTEMEHSRYSPNLAPNDFWLFPKIKSAFKIRRHQDIKGIQTK
jgi:hypothetical protein